MCTRKARGEVPEEQSLEIVAAHSFPPQPRGLVFPTTTDPSPEIAWQNPTTILTTAPSLVPFLTPRVSSAHPLLLFPLLSSASSSFSFSLFLLFHPILPPYTCARCSFRAIPRCAARRPGRALRFFTRFRTVGNQSAYLIFCHVTEDYKKVHNMEDKTEDKIRIIDRALERKTAFYE